MKVLILILINIAVLAQKGDKNSDNDFLVGSTVKSDLWEIDRQKNIEIFRGNVFFENEKYQLKSNKAIYNHNTKEWIAEGNVYCRKKIEDKNYIEVFADRTEFFENMNKGNLYSNQGNKILLRYITLPDVVYKAFSQKIHIDGEKKTITFYDKFRIDISSITGYSDMAVYNIQDNTLTMMPSPYIVAKDKEFEMFLKGDMIMINISKTKKMADIRSSVYGVIYKK